MSDHPLPLSEAGIHLATAEQSIADVMINVQKAIDGVDDPLELEVLNSIFEAYKAMSIYIVALHKAQIALVAGHGQMSPDALGGAWSLLTQSIVPHELLANVAQWLNEGNWCEAH